MTAVFEFIAQYWYIFVGAYLLINIAAYIAFAVDKYRSKRDLWRVKEATLLIFAALFGGLGSFLGMITLRHKTKHLKFTLTVPVLMLLQLFACFTLFWITLIS
ncbi:MAG: DUF1294 domain-containing protein [Clostridia bacterium]|nr:DUF1294 domain-containing protein [Clostridia bacterium]